MRYVTALWMVSLLAACRAAPAASQPRFEPARVTSPADLFPDDLDFVVRIDAARVRQNPALAGVVRDLAKTSRSELLESIKAAFGDASAVWVGTRWMTDGFHGDGVLAIETSPGGDTAGLRDAAGVGGVATPFRRVAVKLPEVDVFERHASARGEAVLQVVMRGRGVVLATAAEADAVLRVMNAGPDAGRLDPPARGLVSCAGRLRAGAPLGDAATSALLRGLTEGLVGYAAALEEGEAIQVEASLAYASVSDAARAAKRVKETAERFVAGGGTLGTLADSVKLTEVGSSVRIRAAVPFAWLAELH
ncbi:MAG TPA: hypothetical protein VK540_22325 [Polyangiaceae bacterium]|nr:hypothetical protein [Polyangiaceae bacterium]